MFFFQEGVFQHFVSISFFISTFDSSKNVVFLSHLFFLALFFCPLNASSSSKRNKWQQKLGKDKL